MAKRKNTPKLTMVPKLTVAEAALAEDAVHFATQEALVADVIAQVEVEHDADEKVRGRSVVPLGYKKTYATRAVLAGQTSKAAKRQNGDWLAQELLAECVPDGKTFDLARFLAICEANGIADPMTRWPNRNSGWQGRLRMSGSVMLRGIVAKSGVFRTPDAEIRLNEIPEAQGFLAKWDGRNH